MCRSMSVVAWTVALRSTGAGVSCWRRAKIRSCLVSRAPRSAACMAVSASRCCRGSATRDCSRSRLPMMAASTLLKSCAMPPVNCPTASISEPAAAPPRHADAPRLGGQAGIDPHQLAVDAGQRRLTDAQDDDDQNAHRREQQNHAIARRPLPQRRNPALQNYRAHSLLAGEDGAGDHQHLAIEAGLGSARRHGQPVLPRIAREKGVPDASVMTTCSSSGSAASALHIPAPTGGRRRTAPPIRWRRVCGPGRRVRRPSAHDRSARLVRRLPGRRRGAPEPPTGAARARGGEARRDSMESAIQLTPAAARPRRSATASS